jgi:hypothetical protein
LRTRFGPCGLVFSADPTPEGSHRLDAQIGNLQIVAQHVVTVELDQGIEIEKCLQPGENDHDQSDLVDQRIGIRDPPHDGAQTPYNQLKISSGKCHPHPLTLRGKHP